MSTSQRPNVVRKLAAELAPCLVSHFEMIRRNNNDKSLGGRLWLNWLVDSLAPSRCHTDDRERAEEILTYLVIEHCCTGAATKKNPKKGGQKTPFTPRWLTLDPSREGFALEDFAIVDQLWPAAHIAPLVSALVESKNIDPAAWQKLRAQVIEMELALVLLYPDPLSRGCVRKLALRLCQRTLENTDSAIPGFPSGVSANDVKRAFVDAAKKWRLHPTGTAVYRPKTTASKSAAELVLRYVLSSLDRLARKKLNSAPNLSTDCVKQRRTDRYARTELDVANALGVDRGKLARARRRTNVTVFRTNSGAINYNDRTLIPVLKRAKLLSDANLEKLEEAGLSGVCSIQEAETEGYLSPKR